MTQSGLRLKYASRMRCNGRPRIRFMIREATPNLRSCRSDARLVGLAIQPDAPCVVRGLLALDDGLALAEFDNLARIRFRGGLAQDCE